jgi:hypothetical protein
MKKSRDAEDLDETKTKSFSKSQNQTLRDKS